MSEERLSIYEMSICVRLSWQAHSMSNIGSDGSIRILPRRQLLADGTEVDAASGNLAKRHHSMLLAEYCEELGVKLCPACQERDGRRVAAIISTSHKGLNTAGALTCGLCDAHGFLVTPKRKKEDGSDKGRKRLAKHSLIEFSFALALPDKMAESSQIFTRSGDDSGAGQILYRRNSRSGHYGLCIRYKCVGIGVDTNRWRLIIEDEKERELRHKAILLALRDQILSPSGATTSTMLPHLTGIEGVIAIRTKAGRAPLISPLHADFVKHMNNMVDDSCQTFSFDNVSEFRHQMQILIEKGYPCSPKQH